MKRRFWVIGLYLLRCFWTFSSVYLWPILLIGIMFFVPVRWHHWSLPSCDPVEMWTILPLGSFPTFCYGKSSFSILPWADRSIFPSSWLLAFFPCFPSLMLWHLWTCLVAWSAVTFYSKILDTTNLHDWRICMFLPRHYAYLLSTPK